MSACWCADALAWTQISVPLIVAPIAIDREKESSLSENCTRGSLVCLHFNLRVLIAVRRPFDAHCALRQLGDVLCVSFARRQIGGDYQVNELCRFQERKNVMYFWDQYSKLWFELEFELIKQGKTHRVAFIFNRPATRRPAHTMPRCWWRWLYVMEITQSWSKIGRCTKDAW